MSLASTADIRFNSACFEEWLGATLPPESVFPQPLHRAMRYAVLAPGKRLRPRLLLGVAEASLKHEIVPEANLVLNAACAVELLHCASLVHDDLPCFDDADMRRNQPTVHRLFGEPMAVLVGDALLARAFELLAETKQCATERVVRIIRLLGQLAGSRTGLIGGQSLELGVPTSLPEHVVQYHEMKTAALFRLAAEAGAIAVGADHVESWAVVGRNLGLAFQLMDDLMDIRGDEKAMGKPAHRDASLGRPNAALLIGQAQVLATYQTLLNETRRLVACISRDPCPLLSILDSFHDPGQYGASGLLLRAPEGFAGGLGQQ